MCFVFNSAASVALSLDVMRPDSETVPTNKPQTLKQPKLVFLFLSRFDRLEVLAVFASTVLIQLGALFILKERCVRHEHTHVYTRTLTLQKDSK